ncbi:MAG: hypothetical protein WC264_00395 [Candidatus Paceibacterota bacterium]|jgi:hypothetical protein
MDPNEKITNNNKKLEDSSLFLLDFSYPKNAEKSTEVKIQKYTQESIQCISVGLYKT